MPFDVVLDANAVLGKVREAFDTEAQNESKRASKLMANMYAAVEKAYPAKVDARIRDHEISVTLARILFLMFGDDTEMWETDAFRNVIQHEVLPDGSNLAQVLNDLFTFLDTAKPDGVPASFGGFKYVNGGIFEEPIKLPPLGKDFRTAILEACAVDWSGISPAIFGSMFQSVRDAETRRALGEHYTSEENILKTLNPLFLDELRDELASALARDSTQKRVNSLNKLWHRLGEIRFMDPACGCGNFIIVAYRELRAIELQVMEALSDLRDQHQLSLDAKADLKVTLDHFYGIEIDEWPARIAETAMFMMDRQCDLKLQERFGQAPERLPIQREAMIQVGDALEVAWDGLCIATPDVYVAGNPPFLGHISRTTQQTEQLRKAWGGGDIGRLDYVTAWYAKAMSYFGTTLGRWAFVSTNSVTQGDQVPRLFGPIFASGWRVRFGHRTFAWASEAADKAAVHCNVIGFDRESGPGRIFEYVTPSSSAVARDVPQINGYLVAGPNVLIEPRRDPLSPELTVVTFGNMPRDGGHLIVEPGDYDEVASDPIAAAYLRPFVGSEELVNGRHRWCLWMTELDPLDLGRSAVLRARVEGVRQMRLKSKASSTKAMASTPHLFGQRSGGYKTAYLGIPRVVSENRPYYLAARLGPEVIPSDRLFTAPDPDGLLFGVISSTMFLTWQLTVGNRLESRPSFSNTLVWNNFPLPGLDHPTRAAIIAAGRRVQQVREAEGSSLASLYGSTLTSPLLESHAALDEAVDHAFSVENCSTLTVEDRQDVLFRTYMAMSSS